MALCVPSEPVLTYFAEEPVHVVLLVPMTGVSIANEAGAAALAVKAVNADKTLLAGRVLEYDWADSGCSAKQGLAAMGELLGGQKNIDAVMGPGCSSACELTSYLSTAARIPQISHSCMPPSILPPFGPPLPLRSRS